MDNERKTLTEKATSTVSTDDESAPLDFDNNVLQQLVSSRLNRRCVCTSRLTRGSYNEVYLLKFDYGPDCIARFPRNPVYPTAKIASEVATMKYIAQNTSIKVPEVYDWDCTDQNPIKFPYILMEHISGLHLCRIWDELTIKQKKSVLSQIVDTLLELWKKCQFDEIGCLYMDDQLPSDSSVSTEISFSLFHL
jgi:aminoglycoside phosphotransferase (APT) family kinase protein